MTYDSQCNIVCLESTNGISVFLSGCGDCSNQSHHYSRSKEPRRLQDFSFSGSGSTQQGEINTLYSQAFISLKKHPSDFPGKSRPSVFNP